VSRRGGVTPLRADKDDLAPTSKRAGGPPVSARRAPEGALATPVPGSPRANAPLSLSPPNRSSLDGDRPVAKPLLASEALIEDLAPLEPARSAARLWCAALGGGFLLFGLLALVGLGPGGAYAAAPEIVLGSIALVAALVRITYRQRAGTMIMIGLLSAVVGMRGPGAAGWIDGWSLLRTLAAITLPAALLFRARYRAYTPARWILGAAVASALPFVAYSIWRLLRLPFGFETIGAAIALTAVLASLLGFMGEETTGGGTATALGAIVALSADVALGTLAALTTTASLTQTANVIAWAAAFAGTWAMAALGMFQILAWRFAADARRINLHAKPKETKVTQPSVSDWSTKD
jgi:hypothetical protein